MNLWAPRGAGPRAEARVLSMAWNWFISTKTSGPAIGEVQDSIIGAYELTRSGVRMDRRHAMALFAATGLAPPVFGQALYTGREAVSLLLTAYPVNLTKRPTSFNDVYSQHIDYPDDEKLTVIEQGVLVRGVLDKSTIGPKAAGGLFHLIYNEYGARVALFMVYALQQVALRFLMSRGFSVGTADLLPGPGALDAVRDLVEGVALEARVITDRLLRGEIVPPIGKTVHEFYEQQQINALKVDERSVLRHILGSTRPADNGFFRMIATGSKGSNPNLIHVAGYIGQTEINGERIGELFAFRRTLPYFPRFASEPAAYGFVANSYIAGMTAKEFIFQGMNGRYDLINKALSTSVTGYFMRKGAMSNQSSLVDNYRRVSKNTAVVQWLYGEDGVDPRALESVAMATVMLSDAELALFALPGGEGFAGAEGFADVLGRLREDRDRFRRAFGRLEESDFVADTFRAGGVTILLPVNVRRIVEGVYIEAARAGRPVPPEGAPPLPGLQARVEAVEDLCRRLPYVLVNEHAERARRPVPRRLARACWLLQMAVRAELTPRVLARLSPPQFASVVEKIRQQYAAALVDYGTAAGLLAVQACCEPLTQYMLDSHHRSVQGGTNKSGMARVAEIFQAYSADRESAAAMLLPLRAQEGAEGAAQMVANALEHISLAHFVSRYSVLLEPADDLRDPEFRADAAWMAECAAAHPLARRPGDLTNWCFRFELDPLELELKGMSLETILGALHASFPTWWVVHTRELARPAVIRAWQRAAGARGAARDHLAVLRAALESPVRGVRGVQSAAVKRHTRHRAGPGGGLAPVEGYAVHTQGTNLAAAILHPAVDPARAISNSVADTFKLLGIEAARAKIVSEARSFMKDSVPNMRHLFLFAEELTRTGRHTSVERQGLDAREAANVLLRMAYGDPVRTVSTAASRAAVSPVYGLAAQHLLGSVPRVGSQYNSYEVNTEFVAENVKSVDQVLDEL